MASTVTLRVEVGGKSAIVGPTEFVIGRSVYCTLVVDDGSVSRLHASIRKTEDGHEIADLGSFNGTFVNGERIGRKPVPVKAGDEVRLGNLELRLMVDTARGRERSSTNPHPQLCVEDQPTVAMRDWPFRAKLRTGGEGE